VSRTVLSVVGARPNFMKLAPVARALARRDVRHVVVHTGQHYDDDMSAAFFRDLGIAAPDVNLGVGSGSHARQTAAIMLGLEPVLLAERPACLLVYGDVNSTAAAALVAAQLGISTAHVEAGLRSHDWSMPEEINRVVTDRLAHLLLTPSRDADANLRAEGVPAERIHFVGNVMIDTLVHALPAARAWDAPRRLAVGGRRYVVVTLHRPSNVDDPRVLGDLFAALARLARELPVLFPVHPRTRARLTAAGLGTEDGAVRLLAPVGYLDMLSLVNGAALVVTDSGGLQEETSYLGVPCLTVRPNTERPITCSSGTNRLVTDAADLERAAREALAGPARRPVSIERWDGQAGERIVEVMVDGAEYR
jgi:UDP-N-acetylglucosamine 2-epimerase (non-hydrolysing)